MVNHRFTFKDLTKFWLIDSPKQIPSPIFHFKSLTETSLEVSFLPSPFQQLNQPLKVSPQTPLD
jgi:hypothetical protein